MTDINEADNLVRAYANSVTEWALMREACDRSGGSRSLWAPMLEAAMRRRDEAGADLRRALIRD